MGLLLLSLGNKIERGQRMVKEVGAVGCLGTEPTFLLLVISFQRRSRDSTFFFDRSRGISPPIGKCEGPLVKRVVAAALASPGQVDQAIANYFPGEEASGPFSPKVVS